MEIKVSPEASRWFEESVGLPVGVENAGIRFKTKIYGSSPVNRSFALAIQAIAPEKPVASFVSEAGLLFFVEEADAWFFDGHDLHVEYDQELDEPKYVYIKDGKAL